MYLMNRSAYGFGGTHDTSLLRKKAFVACSIFFTVLYAVRMSIVLIK
jgi:hypothetical protein